MIGEERKVVGAAVEAGGYALMGAALLGLPLLGVWLDGKDVRAYMEFPPLTQHVRHAPFAWPVFIVMAIFIGVFTVPFFLRTAIVLFRDRNPGSTRPAPVRHEFPWWGWAGLAFGLGAWVLAWTRFPWFAPLQGFTFSPLWFAYIVVVNAIAKKRTGGCMMTDRPRYFAGLFVASAFFWWFFEYLNRFVQNWSYQGVGNFTPLEYFVFATLPFSTVLPAVMGTYELMKSFPAIGAGLDAFPILKIRHSRAAAWVSFVLFGLGLAGVGVFPDCLYPLLWLAPLFIITSIQAVCGRNTVFDGVESGAWRRVFVLAMASLVCGFFWEMWNFQSLARWIYHVPFVERFKMFEMPILGYAGYLPFGLECAAIAAVVERAAEHGNRNAGRVCGNTGGTA